MPRLSYVQGVIAVAATLWILTQARGVLEPLVIAVLFWYVLQAVANTYARALAGPEARPSRWVQAASAVTLVLLLTALIAMVSAKADQLRSALPTYEENLDRMITETAAFFGLPTGVGIDRLIGQVDFTQLALNVAGTTAGFLSGFIVIVIYVIFLFVEATAFRDKLAAMAPDPDRFERITTTIAEINAEIETYMGVKCVVGLAQALPTYLVLWIAGVDGAAFWAVLIFFFSFVPTVGTLIGIAFPAVMTLLQFAEVTPFLVVTGLLAAIQLAGSNVLEPRLMGSSLNLSPLVILIAIFAGGALWGIAGALVAVPALSVAVIVFSRFETMRPVAILLSSDGNV